jgi:hypothetical protein
VIRQLRHRTLPRVICDLVGQIAEALSEADRPYKVDVVDLSTVESGFKARVLGDCVPLPR